MLSTVQQTTTKGFTLQVPLGFLKRIFQQKDLWLVNDDDERQQLDTLDLSGSGLTSIVLYDFLVPASHIKSHCDFLQGHELLNSQLSDDYLVNVNDEQFCLSYMQHLCLGNNPLAVIQQNTFHLLPNLQHLDLSSCRLTVIETGAFRGLSSLKSLNLADNRSLVELRDGAFEGLEQLECLDLARCGLQSIDTPAVFASVPQLRKLFLQENPLKCVHSLAFQALKHLVELCMFGNQLRYLHADTFINQTKLRNLNMYPHELLYWTPGLLRNNCELKFLTVGAQQLATSFEPEAELDACCKTLQRLDGKEWRMA